MARHTVSCGRLTVALVVEEASGCSMMCEKLLDEVCQEVVRRVQETSAGAADSSPTGLGCELREVSRLAGLGSVSLLGNRPSSPL